MPLRVLRDPVAVFVARQTFHCKPLNANLTPEQCKDRQLREIETKMFGRKLTVNNSLFDRYCRSGCCPTGLVYLKKLAPAAYKVRVKETKARKTPCTQLAGGNAPAP